MRKYIALVLVILLSACSSNEVKEDESPKVAKASETSVVSAEAEEMPWDKYDTEEIYDVVNEGEQVFTLDHADAIEEEFSRLYESGELTPDWGKYLHAFGAELHPNHDKLDEYLKTVMNVGINVRNENYDEANRLMEHAKVLREDAN